MKKVEIITIIDDDNYGNKLQNYATESILKELKLNVKTIKNSAILNKSHKSFFEYILRYIKYRYLNIKTRKTRTIRYKKFIEFNNFINITDKVFNIKTFRNVDLESKFIVGSDQVWNPNFGRFRDVDLLTFANPEQKIAFSASFGVNELPENLKEYARRNLETFKAISVREDAGKKIVEELTGRTDVEVLVDPTMLLTAQEWDKVSKRPEQLDDLKSEKYILNYFLGELPEVWKLEIERIAKENNCEIINILDKQSPFYQTGPSEFIYLEKNAFMVCTDSFHSSVFSIIYDTPFVVFDKIGRASCRERV